MKERILNLQPIKNGLVRLGPQSYIVQLALRFHARRRGFQVTFSSSGIQIRRGGDCMLLNKLQFIQVPIMMECFDLFFDTIKAVSINGRRLLDFSQPALHEYTRKGVCFYFPSIPEDDVVDAYTRGYKPRPGDIVWDAGAHAGASTYFFSHLVGPSGRVFAFEPDDSNYEYLVRNVEMHKLTNVTLVKKALSSNTGVAKFNMDGTMSAGIHDFLVYSGTGKLVEVETITIADACTQFHCVPDLIKMDIEGAEVAAIKGSAEFLARHNVNFAIESFHRLGEQYTYTLLDRLFPRLGYGVKSEEYCGQMFTWAKKLEAVTAVLSS